MKPAILVCIAALSVTACQPAKQNAAEAEKGAVASVAAKGDICEQYFAFVENYAGKQADAVKSVLLKRLNYDKQSLPTRDKKEADEYCKTSLERMERMAG